MCWDEGAVSRQSQGAVLWGKIQHSEDSNVKILIIFKGWRKHAQGLETGSDVGSAVMSVQSQSIMTVVGPCGISRYRVKANRYLK
jgi:hypothetical protein